MRKGKSSQQCIEELCFRNDAPLVKEFERLFASLFEEPTPYTDLIRIIAKHRYGIGQAELIEASQLPNGGSTIEKLYRLEEAGFITGLVPYGHKDRGVYYVIDDEYSLFYLHWIEPNLKTIAKKTTRAGFWMAQSTKPAWKVWMGLAFESICYKHIDQIRQALNIDPGANVGTWRYSPREKDGQDGAQIDLLFDRSDETITVCEIKCSKSLFAIDKSYAHDLLNKVEVFRKQTRVKKQIFLSMITVEGLKPTIHSKEIITSEAILDDLFKGP